MCTTYDDKIVWASSPSGAFEAKNAYLIAKGDSTHQSHFAGSWIWKLDSLPKIQHFLWKCHWQSIPIKEVLAGRGYIGDVTCQLCNGKRETIIHLLRDCPYAAMLRPFGRAHGLLILFKTSSLWIFLLGLRLMLATNQYGMSFSHEIFSLPLLFGTFGLTGTK